MQAVKVHKLGVVMALGAFGYIVRRPGQHGGRTFHSEEIAKAYAREESARTGKRYDVYEYQSGF